MSEFEQQLTSMLTERAERIVVEPDARYVDDAITLDRSTPQLGRVRRQRTRRGRMLAIAAAVLLVGGLAGYLVRSPQNEIGVADDRSDVSEPPGVGSGDVVVWMEAAASPEQIATVASVIDEWSGASAATFVSQTEAYEQFLEFWADEPEIIDAVGPEQLPASFVVDVDDVLPFIAALEDVGGVSDVERGTIGAPSTGGAVGVLWLRHGITDEQRAETLEWVEARRATESVTALQPAWIEAHLRQRWQFDDEITRLLGRSVLPDGYLVITNDLSEVSGRETFTDVPTGMAELEQLSPTPEEVSRTEFHLVPPLDSALVSHFSFTANDLGAFDQEGETVVIGRVTDGGLGDVAIARLTDWSEVVPIESERIIVDNELYFESRDVPGLLAREVETGWLELRAADSATSASVAPSLDVIDGELRVENLPGDLEVIRPARPTGPRSSSLLVGGSPPIVPDGSVVPDEFVSLWALGSAEPNPFLLPVLVGDLRAVEVNGNVGYLADQRTIEADFAPAVLTWWDPAGHQMFLFSTFDPDDAIRLASELEVVDRETWLQRAAAFTLLD